METLETRFRNKLASHLNMSAEKIKLSDKIDQFGFDSVKMMEIYVDLEAEFGQLDLAQFISCEKIDDVYRLILDL